MCRRTTARWTAATSGPFKTRATPPPSSCRAHSRDPPSPDWPRRARKAAAALARGCKRRRPASLSPRCTCPGNTPLLRRASPRHRVSMPPLHHRGPTQLCAMSSRNAPRLLRKQAPPPAAARVVGVAAALFLGFGSPPMSLERSDTGGQGKVFCYLEYILYPTKGPFVRILASVVVCTPWGARTEL